MEETVDILRYYYMYWKSNLIYLLLHVFTCTSTSFGAAAVSGQCVSLIKLLIVVLVLMLHR